MTALVIRFEAVLHPYVVTRWKSNQTCNVDRANPDSSSKGFESVASETTLELSFWINRLKENGSK